VRTTRAVSGIVVDGVHHYFFAQGGMTVIVPGPTENLETFPLGGRFRPSEVHFSRRVDEIKTCFPNSVGLSVNSFRCVLLFITHIRLLTTTLHTKDDEYESNP
jgi:type III secretory pathway component EscT